MEFPVATIECVINFFSDFPEIEKGQKITTELIQERLECTYRNAKKVIKMLELLGFINKNAVPTDVWWRYCEHPQVTLRPILEELYECLYKRYDNPYQESPKAIEDALRSVTKFTESWGRQATRCFRTLHEVANESTVIAPQKAIENLIPKNGVTISIHGLPGVAVTDQDFISVLKRYL